MKKRFASCLTIVVLISFCLPLKIDAAGGYVASSESDVYHVPTCYHVEAIHDNNVIWFKTKVQAKAAGYRPCADCNPDKLGRDFYRGETYAWYSSNPQTQLAFEEEYAAGLRQGYDKGYDAGYSAGRSSGRDTGYELGYNAGVSDTQQRLNKEHRQALAKNTRETVRSTLLAVSIIVFPTFLILILWTRRKLRKQQCLEEIAKVRQEELHDSNMEVLQRITPEASDPGYAALHNVESSCISKLDYTEEVLYICFSQGETYAYYNVPKSVYEELVQAQSKGRYFHEKINGVYPYVPYHE